MSKLLVYIPNKRLTALEALAHPYFDELRNEKLTINNKPLPDLFNFTKGYYFFFLHRKLFLAFRGTFKQARINIKINAFFIIKKVKSEKSFFPIL